MQHLFSAKRLVAAAAAVGALGVTAAHAGSDVHFSIGVHAPLGYVQPATVYVQPQPVYVQPQPAYVHPQPVYVYPRSGYHGYHYRSYERRGPWGDRDGDGVPNIHDPDSRYYSGYGYHHRGGGWRDSDRDGVPNRYDRAPHHPYFR